MATPAFDPGSASAHGNLQMNRGWITQRKKRFGQLSESFLNILSAEPDELDRLELGLPQIQPVRSGARPAGLFYRAGRPLLTFFQLFDTSSTRTSVLSLDHVLGPLSSIHSLSSFPTQTSRLLSR